MTLENWDQVQELFLAAADLATRDRVEFLDRTCAGDAALREEVESLLQADRKNGEGIVAAIEREAQSLFSVEGVIGSRIGAYRIVDEIGRGGMGTVYGAVRDDDQYQKKVAIKLIRRGMDTQDVLDRFRYERQILANLEHQYIARLLDGGTAPDGGPFLVMEYVQGEPLDAYCQHQELPLRERCRLFLKVCEAVSYAHRNLVVHRDLKPGNVLVTADGSPKLLDFGIAKLLDTDPAAGRTVASARAITPDYASPEQIKGEPITTAADVYSLGAILYELLSGQRAHLFSGYHGREIERVICEVDPPRPSEVAARHARQIQGDLDAIVSKALRKEPALRYASVEQLAADIERHLNGWGVLARQGDYAYRARKFLRRNRAAIAASAVFAVVLIGGATVAAIEARRANQERARAEISQKEAEREAREADRQRVYAEAQRAEAEAQRGQTELQRIAVETQRQIAERRFEQVRQLAGKFLVDFHDAIAKLPGSTPARKMVVETGLRYYDTLVQEAQGNRDLLEEIARGYDRLGDVQGNPYYANLGDAAGAMASYRKALAIREKISDSSPEFVRDRILGNIKIAQLLTFSGNVPGASRTLAATLLLGGQGPAVKTYVVREALANAYSAYGDLKIRTADMSESIEPYSKLLQIWTELARENRNPVSEQTGVSLGHTKLADVYTRIDQGREALDHFRIAVDIDNRLAADDPNSIPRLRKLFVDYTLMGILFRSVAGQQLVPLSEARAAMEAGVDLADRMVAADPNNNTAPMDVLMSNSSLGDFLREHGEVSAALLHYRKGLAAAEKVAATGPPSLGTYDGLIQLHHRLGVGLTGSGELDEALENFRKADEFVARAEKQSPGLTRLASRRAEISSGRADAYRHRANWSEAIAAYSVAITSYEDLRKRDPKNETFLNQQPDLSAQLAECYAATQQWDLAIRANQTALDRFQEISSLRALLSDEQEKRRNVLAKLELWKQALASR